jgi:hypothetical protein
MGNAYFYTIDRMESQQTADSCSQFMNRPFER